MRYLMLREPLRREEMHRYLNKAEWYLSEDKDDTLYSALAVIMAEGREQAEEAMVDVAALRRAQVELYLSKLDECHLRDRRDRLSDPLRRWAGIAIPTAREENPGLARAPGPTPSVAARHLPLGGSSGIRERREGQVIVFG